MKILGAAYNTMIANEKPENEDAGLVRKDIGFVAIADGFGGKNVGHSVSKKILEDIAVFVENGLGDSEVTLPFVYRSYYSSQANLLFNAASFANRELFIENKNKPINLRGGTSACFALIQGRKITIANIGSCTAYLLRGEKLVELVKPRSYNAYKGYSNSSQNWEWKREWAFPIQTFGMLSDVEPEISEFEVCPGDQIFLMTDGVYPHLNEEVFASLKIPAIMHGNEEDIYQQNQILISNLKAKFGEDDSSIISITCG
jgi:serine/threonine protein phosphatase PrpC